MKKLTLTTLRQQIFQIADEVLVSKDQLIQKHFAKVIW